MDSTSEGKRLAYYDSSFSIDKTRISDPNKHTMGASAFRATLNKPSKSTACVDASHRINLKSQKTQNFDR